MKDKEKQIEEIAKRIHIATDLYYMECIKVATYLFEKDNCRIIGKDSVVISREEYESLKLRADDKCKYDCWLIDMPDFEREKDIKTQASKETAEKFANLVYSTLTNRRVWCELKDWWLENGECEKLKILLNKLAKQFGVEIKE